MNNGSIEGVSGAPTFGDETSVASGSGEAEDASCLSRLGISARSHESYEQDIMEQISRKMEAREKEQRVLKAKKKLITVITELHQLIKRRTAKENELIKIYDIGGPKRKIESLLLEQEKLNSRISELDLSQLTLLGELKGLDYDIAGDPLINPVDTKLIDKDARTTENSNEEANTITDQEEELDETQRSVKLGELTSFGSSLEAVTQFDPQATMGCYMRRERTQAKKRGAPQDESKPPVSTAKRKRLHENDSSGSEFEAEAEEDEDIDEEEEESWLTDDSGQDSRVRGRRPKDDGDREAYIERLSKWEKKRTTEDKELDGKFEKLKEGLRIPTSLWNKLFNYQRVAVQWMYELHQQRVGGILGDEMGLGKTVQLIAFLASLSYTKSADDRTTGLGATLVVCPTTVMSQWVSEIHKWWPPFRVAILHSSGSYTGSKSSLIRSINSSRGILVLSYQAVSSHIDLLSNLSWAYIILDEGHKIRNPDAKVTLAVKQIATPHRLILSGSPLQNNLKELWSLFDFIYPGKLGTLPTFIQQFSGPITQGGYSNASQVQVATAFRCATVLKDTINPFLLRRMKADVKQHINLPEKNEQVLFCKLTEEQRALYRSYIESKDTKSILDGRMKVFVGLIALRKICNHPDLFYHDKEEAEEGSQEEEFGWYKRSGKMLVIHSLLRIWRKQGHRVLMFTQSRQMLRVIELYAKSQKYSYLKLDGTTSVSSRQPLIDKFNNSEDIFLFILTTRVGGLGVNLTGADRVVIFDPDWNPSTDTQARERAWRIGQDRQVTIYRLMTSGTIEEKIYHRQIYKQFLVNRVLKDPKQRRFFKSNDLHELFTLNETDNDKTETSAIFAGTGTNIKVTPPPSFKLSKRKSLASSDVKSSLSRLYKEEAEPTSPSPAIFRLTTTTTTTKEDKGDIKDVAGAEGAVLSEAKKAELREKARRISASFAKKKVVTASSESAEASSSRRPSGEGTASGLSTPSSSSTSCSSTTTSTTPSSSAVFSSSISSLASSLTFAASAGPSYTQSSSPTNLSSISSSAGSSSTKVSALSLPSSPETAVNSKHKKKKHKRERKSGGKFEGERVPNLVKTRKYQPPLQDEEEEEKSAQSQDNYVLARLFAKTGVHSAVQHDAILEDGTADYAIIESEANKVASEAINALKASRRECMRAETGVPNWTGTHGKVRKKFTGKKIKSGNLSSSDLLARMKNRNLVSSTVQRPEEEQEESMFFPRNQNGDIAAGSSANQADLDLLADIRNYVAFQAGADGEARTTELVARFQKSLPSQKSPLFKAFLKQICHFRRDEDGRGIWSLKPEFR